MYIQDYQNFSEEKIYVLKFASFFLSTPGAMFRPQMFHLCTFLDKLIFKIAERSHLINDWRNIEILLINLFICVQKINFPNMFSAVLMGRWRKRKKQLVISVEVFVAITPLIRYRHR